MTSEPAEIYRPVPAGRADGVIHLPRIEMSQRMLTVATRYEIREAASRNQPGRFLAIAQQKRVTMKNEVVFFADEARQTPLFSFAARRVMDFAPPYDVVDAVGTTLGSFRKDINASLARTSFHLEGPGFRAYGQERSRTVAFLRRLSKNPKSGFSVDFIDSATAELVLTVERKASIRDSYVIDVLDRRIDFRLAVALTAGLDLDMQP